VVKRPNSHSPLLGKGSFGQVVYAIDTKSPDGKKQEVALKIIKNHHHWYEQAKCEIALLKRFTKMEPVETSKGKKDWVEHANVVRLVDDFEHCNHCCLVFELLPFTLYDLLKYSRFKGVSLQLVSRFAHHMLRALSSLRAADVIHADLKPENVMLVAHDDHRVKVIDFGSSCTSKRQPFTYIQSRFYRFDVFLSPCLLE
jgi:serine/threonine protein kinase